jgi:hypothetical protein
LGWAAVAEARTVQERVPHLPLGFTVVLAEVGFDAFICILVLKIDAEEE